MSIFKKLDELKAIKGKKAKLAFLNDNKDDIQLKQILQWALDPKIVFGMKPKGVPSDLPQFGQPHLFLYIKGILGDIATRRVTGNAAKDHLRLALAELPTEKERQWFLKIVNKKLGLGFSKNTCLKVWSDFCEVFDPMAAKVWDKKTVPFKATIEEFKIDGFRALAVNTAARCVIKSRTGNIFGHMKFLADQIHEVLGDRELVLDGELFYKDWSTTSHLINSSKAIQEEREQLQFFWFDMLPLHEFNSGKSSKPLYQRKDDMMMEGNLQHIPGIHINKWSRIDSLEDIDAMFELSLASGHEGLMLKNAHAKYQCKRSNDMLKYKPFIDVDVEVIGINEGEGRLIGSMGSLTVSHKGKSVNVGSGFSDAQRADIWSMGESIIGTIIECKIQEGRGDASDLMTFRRLRSDKR